MIEGVLLIAHIIRLTVDAAVFIPPSLSPFIPPVLTGRLLIVIAIILFGSTMNNRRIHHFYIKMTLEKNLLFQWTFTDESRWRLRVWVHFVAVELIQQHHCSFIHAQDVAHCEHKGLLLLFL